MNESVTPAANKRQEALQIAKQLFLQKPDWVTFFREILGIGGAARRLFPNQEEFLRFEQSTEFGEIQSMVTALRNKKGNSSDGHEPTRVITVRLPKSLHEALRAEAHDHKTSMNKLCIAKLLQVLDEEDGSTTTPTPVTSRVQANVPTATTGYGQAPTTETRTQPNMTTVGETKHHFG